MATSSVNLLGQVVTVTANVPADPTSNKNMGSLQAVLFQYYGLVYLGGQFSPPQVTLQLQDTNNPPLSALAVVGAVSDALAASIGDPGSNIQASLPTSVAFSMPLGAPSPSGSITGVPGGTASTVGGFGLFQSIQSALSGAWSAVNSALKALFSDLQTGAVVVLVAITIIAVLIVAAKT